MKILSTLALAFTLCSTSLIAQKRALILGVPSHFNGEARDGIEIDLSNMTNLLKSYGFKIDKLIDEEATTTNVKRYMKKYRKLNSDDTFIFYYSGHGAQIKDRNGDEEDGRDEVIVLHDYKFDGRYKGLFIDDEMYRNLIKIPAKKIVFFDSCHSGSAFKSLNTNSIVPKSLGYINNKYTKAIGITSKIKEPTEKEKKSIIFFAAAGDNQQSLATPFGSMFTLSLMDGIKRKKADFDDDGIITFKELLKFTIKDVKRQTKNCPNGSCPIFKPEIHSTTKDIKKDILKELQGNKKDNVVQTDIELDIDNMLTTGEAQPIKLTTLSRYTDGNEVTLEFDSGSYRGYLSVLYIDNDDITVLYPNKFHPKDKKYQGYIEFPSDVSNKFKLTAMEPYGRTVVYVILSDEPLGLYEKGGKSLFRVFSRKSATAKSLRGVMIQEVNSMRIGKSVFTVEERN